MFKVGDTIEPTDEAENVYGTTCKPSMTEGIITEVLEAGYIRLKITKGEEAEEYDHTDFRVKAKYFKLLKPLTADEAFVQLVQGRISDDEYDVIMNKIHNT